MQVAIDGVQYVPASQQQSRIGIAITTYNRDGVLSQALEHHLRNSL
ncbi:hypothetical protein [Cronobacter sakazakii]|nr:hypothetical protein [Cronobacter sakazakii]